MQGKPEIMETRRLNLPLNPLRAFAVASRHKTFTAAAQELGVSQVAISRQIAILENYLNVSLFERSTRSAKLTEIGRAFGSEIAGLFDDIESATQRIIKQNLTWALAYNLAILPPAALGFVPAVVMGLKLRKPNIQTELVLGSNSDLLRKLHEGVIDASLMGLPEDAPDVESQLMFEDDVFFAAPEGSRYEGQAEVDLQ